MSEELGISKKELDKQYKKFTEELDADITFIESNILFRPKKHSRFTEWLIKILS